MDEPRDTQIHINDDGTEEILITDAIGIGCDVGLVRNRGIIHILLYDGAGPPMEAAIELTHLEEAMKLLTKEVTS